MNQFCPLQRCQRPEKLLCLRYSPDQIVAEMQQRGMQFVSIIVAGK